MLKYWCLFWSFVAVTFAKSIGSDEDFKAFVEYARPSIRQCATQHGIQEAEFKAAQKEHRFDTLDPCFIRCFLNKGGIINDEGLFVLEKELDIVKMVVKNEEDLASYHSSETKCLAVNDKPVSDGAAGCDRAKMLITCELETEVNRYFYEGLEI